MKEVSKGNEYTQLRNAYEYWDAQDSGELKDAAYTVVACILELYNDSVTDDEDVIEDCELGWLFGVE